MKKSFRILTLLVILFSFVFSNPFLDTNDAFKVKIVEGQNDLFVQVSLAEDIYIYKDKFSIHLTSPKQVLLNGELDFPKSSNFHESEVFSGDFDVKIPFSVLKKYAKDKEFSLEVLYQGCAKNGICYQPLKLDFQSKNYISDHEKIALSFSDTNPILVLLSFFVFGLLLSLTPCVFPMIPILSSIIVSQMDEKRSAKKAFFLSLIYVLSMSFTYAIAGVLAGLLGSNIQAFLQNPYALTFFSLIFVLLALSMFGFYDIELPKSFQNKISKKTSTFNQKGIIGVIIMGVLSALMAGPCVAAPLAGALIYIGQSGDALFGGLALFTLSIGMGVLLLVIGTSAGKFLPRPGIWMERIKNIFGVILLALALYMLQRVLPTQVSLLLWALLFIFCAIFMNALENLKTKSFFDKFVKALGVVFLIYGIILFIGAFSGGKSLTSPLVFQKSNTFNTKSDDFTTIKNLNELENIIKTSQKPILLDFYASWCISCKELEEITFSNLEVKNALKNFTLLRVDLSKNSREDKEFLKRFNLFGPPAIVFFKDKNELKEFETVGFKNPKEFLDILSKI